MNDDVKIHETLALHHQPHCCACADKEDVREISATVLSAAQAVLPDAPDRFRRAQ
jgi:hypothetical protein